MVKLGFYGFPRLKWSLQYLLRKVRRWGAADFIVLGLFLIALMLGVWSRQQEAKLAVLTSAREARASNEENSRPPVSVSDELSGFVAYLPPYEDIPDILKRLLIAAEDSGITAAAGDYKLERGQGLSIYRMTFPIKGEPSAIQSFMIAALKKHQSLALESVTFHRERTSSSELDARISFLLLARLPVEESSRKEHK